MSSFLCFICHNAVNADTTEETRDKYREVVDVNLCPDSHLCHICCHMINKLWTFKSICIKRIHEYPVLFSEKSTISLHRSEIESIIVCSEETCSPNSASHLYFRYNDENRCQSNNYVELKDESNDFDEYAPENTMKNAYLQTNYPYNSEQVSTETSKILATVQFDNDENTTVNEFQSDDYRDMKSEHFEANVNETNDDEFNDNDSYKSCDDNLNGNDIDNNNEGNVEEIETIEGDKSIHNEYEKSILSLEEQKRELDGQRRSKKYMDAEFKCHHCALGFLFKDSYQTHMMRHEESNGEHVCHLCTLRFASIAVLRSHKAGHKERYTCCHCGARVRKRQRDTHARKCHKKEQDNAPCHLCGNVFQHTSGLQQHLKRFHMTKNRNRTYSCSVCGKSYDNQAAVRTHMIKHIQRKFNCEICSANFSSPYTLAKHKKNKHDSISEDQTHMCVTCGVGYKSRKSLLAHMRTALPHQNRVYDCPICNRVYPNSNALSTHMSRIHSTTKDFGCSLCGHKFTTRKSLLRHIREHMSPAKIKKSQCHLCGKKFSANSKLNRHLREVCGKDKLEEELSTYEHNTII